MIDVKSYFLPSYRRSEILRYMKVKEETEEIRRLIDRALKLCENQMSGKVCFSVFPIEINNGKVDLSFAKAESNDLAKALKGCDSMLLFAATLGIGIDRLLLRYGKTEPSLALCLQAIGAERVEALCDAFCADIKEIYKNTSPRFSPGYGDLDLSLQKEIFNALQCEKSIGLTLNDSLLMSPSKSITAIVGIKTENKEKQ